MHEVAQATDAQKLFSMDLNRQRIGRFDQELGVGSDDFKGALYFMKLLQDSGGRLCHFGAYAYCAEAPAGAWEFEAECTRSYRIYQDNVLRFHANPEIQHVLATLTGLSDTKDTVMSPDDGTCWVVMDIPKKNWIYRSKN